MRHVERFVCNNCGTEFWTRRKSAKYCSHFCANQKTSGEKMNYERCPHNEAVCCYIHKCRSCGWNPRVAQERTDRLRKELAARGV